MEITKEVIYEALKIAVDELGEMEYYRDSGAWVIEALKKAMELKELQ